MATSTTNLGLTKPAYSDDADIADINDNMDILDAKIGAVGNTSVQNQINSASASISANAQNIGKLKDDVAITEDGDTATHSISTGQYVIWKGDMYKATQNIAVSATLSSSNLDAISSGVSNDLGYKLNTHNHDDRYYTESEIDTQIGTLNQALQTHNHDDRYYTESEIDTQVAGLNARIDALDPEQGVGIFTDVAFSIPLSSWTASNNVWTYTYVNPVITARSGIDVIYDSSYRTAMKGDVDIVKNTGNIVFTTNRQPVGSLSGTVRVFDSVQGVLTTDKGGTGGTTAQAARENLGIYANNIQMSSSDNTSVSSAIDTNSTAIANKADYLNLAKTEYTVNSLADLQTALTTEVAKMSGRSSAVVMIAFGTSVSQFPGGGTWAFLITKAGNTTYFNAYAHYATGKRGTIGGQIVMVGYDDGVWTITNITPVPTTFNLSPPSGWTMITEYSVCVGNFVYISGMLRTETGITAKSLVCPNMVPDGYSTQNRIAFAAFDNTADTAMHGILQGRQLSFYRSETTNLKNIEFSLSYYI